VKVPAFRMVGPFNLGFSSEFNLMMDLDVGNAK
jgi:hypothetical protein